MTMESRILDRVLERTIQICAVPAPPLDEDDRAAVVESWFELDGCTSVHRDDVGNVWGLARPGDDSPGNDSPAVVVCAHLDTVFARSVEHGVRREGDRLVGPSVGDDSVALAALSCLADLLPDYGAPVWLMASVGEEGHGNLRGAREAIANPPVSIGTFIAIEGNYLGRIGVTGVGSIRWRVSFHGAGGHSWERADAPSAVHAAGTAIAALDRVHRGRSDRVAVNVGLMSGGEAINARAQFASFDLDLRATSDEVLSSLVDEARAALAGIDHPSINVEIEELGNRPAGSIDPEHPLVLAALTGYRSAGITCDLIASSTDANVAFAAGIPAIAVGVAFGENEHTEEEWIDVTSLGKGMAGLVATVAAVMRGFDGDPKPAAVPPM